MLVRNTKVARFRNHVAHYFLSAVLLAIFPWIGLLSSAVLILVLFAAARRREQSPMGMTSRSLSQPPISDAEKADHKHES